MTADSILTSNGKKVFLNRAYKATPDYAQPTQFKVGITNATPNVADTDLTDAKLTKNIDSNYPVFDETNNEVEIRCTVATTEANSNDIDGFGIFNEDTSPLMLSEDTFTAESKTSEDELLFIVKDRIE